MQQEINEEDERILAAFMPKDAGPQQTLADVIIRKIREKDAEVAMGMIFPFYRASFPCSLI